MTTRQMHEMTHRERVVARRQIETRQARHQLVAEGVTYLVLIAAFILVQVAGQ